MAPEGMLGNRMFPAGGGGGPGEGTTARLGMFFHLLASHSCHFPAQPAPSGLSGQTPPLTFERKKPLAAQLVYM